MPRFCRLAAAALVVASSATAQFVPERHYIVSNDDGIFAVDRQGATVTTYAVDTDNTGRYNAVAMAPGNGDLATIFSPLVTGTSRFSRVNIVGIETRLTTISGVTQAFAPDQNGQWVIATGAGEVFLTSGSVSNGPMSTIATGLVGANAITIDDDTGDYIVGRFLIGSGGLVHRIDRRTGRVTTMATVPSSILAIDHNQRTGDFVVVSANEFHLVDGNGSILRKIGYGGNAVFVDDVTGHIHLADGTGIREFDENLQIARTVSAPTLGSSINGITIWGSRKLCPASTNTNRVGSYWRATGAFPDSKRASYFCAISVSGLRGGIDIGAGRINITPDALMFLTASQPVPFFTKRFSGLTSSSGSFSAEFVLPSVSVAAIPVTFAAVAVNPNKPGGLDLAASLTVKILP